MQLQPQIRHSPVIVGDHYELAEAVALKYSGESLGGLLAKAGTPPALLPMSGYEKPEVVNANRKLPCFDSTAPLDISVTFGLIP